jgi:hypothetical protein
LIFESNPGFVFHDSRGFEAGVGEELELVQDFIAQRAHKNDILESLHVIWYDSDYCPHLRLKMCGEGIVFPRTAAGLSSLQRSVSSMNAEQAVVSKLTISSCWFQYVPFQFQSLRYSPNLMLGTRMHFRHLKL